MCSFSRSNPIKFPLWSISFLEDCSTGLNICFTRRAHIGEITNKGWTALRILYESSHPGLALK